VSRSTASASRIVRGAVFSAVRSLFGGLGVPRVEGVRGRVRPGSALVRFIAGEADLVRVEEDLAFVEDDADLRDPVPDDGAERPVSRFFAAVLLDFFAATPPDFRAVAPRLAEPALLANALRAGDARFDFAYAISYGSLLFNRLLSGEPRLLLSSAIVSSSGSAGASPAMRGATHRREP